MKTIEELRRIGNGQDPSEHPCYYCQSNILEEAEKEVMKAIEDFENDNILGIKLPRLKQKIKEKFHSPQKITSEPDSNVVCTRSADVNNQENK